MSKTVNQRSGTTLPLLVIVNLTAIHAQLVICQIHFRMPLMKHQKFTFINPDFVVQFFSILFEEMQSVHKTCLLLLELQPGLAFFMKP